MSEIITVIGGTSSGKSKFAQELACSMGKNRAYIATAEITDDDMRKKIQKHIDNRANDWDTFESYNNIDDIINQNKNYDIILLECITNMINNLMYHSNIDFENCPNEEFESFCFSVKDYAENIITAMKSSKSSFVAVTNEMGLSVIPANRYTRRFVALQGELNQIFCDISDKVYFVVSGIATKIK